MTPQQVRNHLARRRDRLVVFGRVNVEDGLIAFSHFYLVTHTTDMNDPIVCVARFDPSVLEAVKIWHGLGQRALLLDTAEQCYRDLSDFSNHASEGLRPDGDHFVTCNQGSISIEHPQMLQILFAVHTVISQSAFEYPHERALLHRLRALIDQANRDEAQRHHLP